MDKLEFDPAQPGPSTQRSQCPICSKCFPMAEIENHVDLCLSNPPPDEEEITASANFAFPAITEPKRNYDIFNPNKSPVPAKRAKLDGTATGAKKTDRRNVGTILPGSVIDLSDDEGKSSCNNGGDSLPDFTGRISEVLEDSNVPLAERVRPIVLDDYVGQEQIIGNNTMLRKLLSSNQIPSMILWGPPGCGKTTLAHIIANSCKQKNNTRFVKLSATMSGVQDVKDAVKAAANEMKFKRKTIMFMDEIHRFNRAQQDIFLPHVEKGTITLIGATTENPSFSIVSALLSRCQVIVLEKLSVDSMMKILERALPEYQTTVIARNNNYEKLPDFLDLPFTPRMLIKEETIRWLAETCDGDARIGLNSLQLVLRSCSLNKTTKVISLEDVKEGVKKSHLLYDRKGDQHYDMISALHKSIRASEDNAALYWCTRMLISGEDPRYLCRRMIRIASEDIGLADGNALTMATSTLYAVQSVGMPEADCIVAHCAVYLARAPKCRTVYDAFKRCKASLEQQKGPMPSVPLPLRNAPTKLMKDLNYGAGYNLSHKDESGLVYMPEGLEDVNYFSE